jgi:ABC-type uncharacterized transport system involved in gliding motility auxiliary subunit
MKADWIKARQTKYGAYLAGYLVIIIAVLGIANWLASEHVKSFDTTSNKRFSLSDQTEKVVKGLKQDATIEYFDRTGNFSGAGGAKDLLDRYANLSSKLHVEYIDPEKKPLLARADGVKTIPSTVIKVNGKREEAKSLSEEEITSALIRGLKGGTRMACFVTGAGEHSLDDTQQDGYSSIKDVLERNNYQTRSINLTGANKEAPTAATSAKIGQAVGGTPEVPGDCTILVVGGPRYNYSKPEVDAIKKFVENGGDALFMVSPPLHIGEDDSEENPELTALLASWGVTLDKDLVLDFSGDAGPLFGPEMAIASQYESHAISRVMKDVPTMFRLTRSLDVKNGDKTTVEKLFETSDKSLATTNLSSAEVKIDPKKDKKGPFVLGAAGTYNGTKQGRFVVTGTAAWVTNGYLRFRPNRDLFLNMMNWLSSDEDLISIRPKEPADQQVNLQKLGQSSPRIFFASIVFLPVIVIVSGITVWWKRR